MTQKGSTSPLPIMVGFGGINAAGRASFHNAYRRLVIDSLPEDKQNQTYTSLAKLMRLENDGLLPETREYIKDHTLIRKIEIFDPESVIWQSAASLKDSETSSMSFIIPSKQLPESIPESWTLKKINDKETLVSCSDSLDVLLPDKRISKVTSAGQVPTGFDPSALYASRSHPRGLQLTVYGASDSLKSTGFSIEELRNLVRPDEIAVYSGSAMGQLDENAYGGLLQNPLTGRRPTSKHCALGLPEMPGDFVNAYILGSVGETAGIIGACATFLYNVKKAIDDIRSGSKRIVVVGNSEAPVVPHVIEGYRVMGALAEDDALRALDQSDFCDNRRACRPFSSNAGFTCAEASIWLVLMDDELALSSGARILGSVPDVFVHADGYKKSIPGPGIGNYITVAKAMASAKSLLGEKTLQKGSFMQAHGTGTPQNRVTESHILNEMAKNFGINSWLTGAVKCYLGHSMAPAGGDQLSAILGTWEDGWFPGINTIDHIADDVYDSNLNLPFNHVEVDSSSLPVGFVNSKGFGGNNATGVFVSPEKTLGLLKKRWGIKYLSSYYQRVEKIELSAQEYNEKADDADTKPIYQFGEGVIEGEDLKISKTEVVIPGFDLPISLELENLYPDLQDE
ncbi:beta-ketoacyl synthase [Gammaproteobacteria bacterium]|nr:beta-ketoacyl synthase [Gammaproteobacteria bacterium]